MISIIFNPKSISIDFVLAFPQADLDFPVYVRLPVGIESGPAGHKVLRLSKTIYGLKQAAHNWFQKLDTVFQAQNFVPSKIDQFVYFFDDFGFGERLAQRLRQAGRSVVAVRRAESFQRESDEEFAIAANEDDCRRLLAELEKRAVQIDDVIYMWSLGRSSVPVGLPDSDTRITPPSEQSADETIQLELSFYVP